MAVPTPKPAKNDSTHPPCERDVPVFTIYREMLKQL